VNPDLEALRVAVDTQHRRLDAWLAVLEGCLSEADLPGDVETDPRFDAAVDDLAEADVQRQLLALEVLGVDVADELADDTDPAPTLAADMFGVDLVVGVAEDTDPARLDDVLDVLDAATDDLIEQLESAGFVVAEVSLSRGAEDDELDSTGEGPEDQLDALIDQALSRLDDGEPPPAGRP
jgi:hypothetical protein